MIRDKGTFYVLIFKYLKENLSNNKEKPGSLWLGVFALKKRS